MKIATRHVSKAGIVAIIVAMIPPAMAILPWDFGEDMTPLRAILRGMALPVVICEIIAITFAVSAGFKPYRYLNSVDRIYKTGLLLLTVIALYTSVFVATSPELALMGFNIWAVHLLFGFSIYALAREGKLSDDIHLWSTVGCGILIYSIILAFFVSTVENPDSFPWSGLLPGNTNVRQLGFIAAIGFAAGVVSCTCSLRNWVFWLGFIFSTTGMSIALWSGNRGVLVALTAGLFAAIIVKPELRTIRFSMWLIGVITAGVLVSVIAYKPNELFGLERIWSSFFREVNTINSVSSGRIIMWEKTAEAIADHPYFGHGENQFQLAAGPTGGGYKQPHNAILQYGYQWGILGGALFFAMVGGLVRRIIRYKNWGQEISSSSIIIIVSTLIYALYDGALYSPYPVAMLVFAIAITLGSFSQPAPAGDRSD